MTKQEFLNMIKKESGCKAWFSGSYSVNSSKVSIKMYNKWVQIIEVTNKDVTFKESIPEQKTKRALINELDLILRGV